MTKCLNCGAGLSCGCQKRVASDGKQVCTNCAAAYEQKLKKQQAEKKASAEMIDPEIKITGITAQFLN